MSRKKQMFMYTIMIGNRHVCKIGAYSAVEALKMYSEMHGAILQDCNIVLARSVLNNGSPIQAVRMS